MRVGGRVLDARGTQLSLADALATIRVTLRKPVALEPGDLVVVDAKLGRGALTDAVVAELHPYPTPRGEGELARFGLGGTGARLAQRARALAVIRRLFDGLGFLEVDTPLRVPAPGLDLHLTAFRAEGGFLTTSPEFQLKRLLVGGLPRVYSLAHCFRAAERGPRHEPEFMMLEWYRAFSGQDEVMADTERVVEAVVQKLAGSARVKLPDGRRVEVRPPFERLGVREAFRRHAGIGDAVELAESDPDRFFELLVGHVEPALAAAKRPVFLCDYPASQASLARLEPSDPSVAQRFELYLGGVELCNGFGELTDPVEQRRRFEADQRARRESGRDEYPIDERFIAALEEGMPPAGGNALGVDRLIALASGAAEIADVQAFPARWL